mgnify:CR=1 FL=1
MPVFNTSMFKNHYVYTQDFGGFLVWGFLHKDDEFELVKVVPRTWNSPGVPWNYTNVWVYGPDEDYKSAHWACLDRLKDRRFCPSRLWKDRMF